jgi:hypothetical protein
MYRRACELGHPSACYYFGWIVRDGIGTTAHPAAGTAILVRSCYDIQRLNRPDGDFSPSCRGAAESFAQGLGVPRDRSRARALLHVYCEERLDCDELYMISSKTTRYVVWVLELFFVVLANVIATPATTAHFRSRWLRAGGLVSAAILAAGVAASVLIGLELAYLLWGSRVSSPLWVLIGAPLAALPLVVAFRQRVAP